MTIFEYVRMIVGVILLLLGVAVFLIEVFGVYRFKYVLNRMHAAALGDTMGITFSLVGLMIISGLNFTTVKMCMVIIFLWVSSPTASHMLSKLEVMTNENLKNYCEEFETPEQLNESAAEDERQSEEGAK